MPLETALLAAALARAQPLAAHQVEARLVEALRRQVVAAQLERMEAEEEAQLRGAAVHLRQDDEELGAHHVLAGESKYPAVTALEQHLFNRDYASDAVGDRLNRLETKVFGKPSRFTDLSERVDALKEKTNIDIAKRPPAGTDWTDDDEDNGQAFPVPKHSEPIARADGDDGRSFSGRDVGSDLRKAFGIGAGGYAGGQSSGSYGMSGTSAGRSGGNSASGAYGMGGTNSGASASYGSGGGSNDRTSNLAMMGGSGAMSGGSNSVSGGSGALSGAKKRPAKAAAPAPDDDNAPPPSNPLGLNQQVSNLESAVLGKTFTQDPLRDRVDRLEKSVFPKETPSDLALPARVARLVQKVPVASQQAVSSAGRSSRGGGDPSSFSSSGASAAARKRPSGWIDEDANLGYGGGSRGSSAGASSDDDDSYGGTGLGSITGLGAGMGGSMGSGMASGMGAGMGSGMAAGTSADSSETRRPEQDYQLHRQCAWWRLYRWLQCQLRHAHRSGDGHVSR